MPLPGFRGRNQSPVKSPQIPLVCPIFYTRFIVSVARLFLLIDSRSRGVEKGSAWQISTTPYPKTLTPASGAGG